MTFIVTKLWTGRGMKITDRWHRTYREIYQVLTSSSEFSQQAVALAPGIPRIGELFYSAGTYDKGARCNDVDAKQTDSENPNVWHVDVSYSSHNAFDPNLHQPQGGSQQEPNQPPWKQPALFHWTTVDNEVAAYETTTTPPVQLLNSAKLPFDPPKAKSDQLLQVTVTRNQRFFDPIIVEAYKDTLNQMSVFGYGPKQAKMMAITSEDAFANNQAYAAVTYVIRFHNSKFEPDWDVRPIDLGQMELTNNARLALARDRAGNPFGRQGMLDGQGKLQLRNRNPASWQPRRLGPFQIYDVVDWTILKIDKRTGWN